MVHQASDDHLEAWREPRWASCGYCGASCRHQYEADHGCYCGSHRVRESDHHRAGQTDMDRSEGGQEHACEVGQAVDSLGDKTAVVRTAPPPGEAQKAEEDRQ